MMYVDFIKKNIISSSIILFILSYTLIMIIKPNIVFDKNGNLRDFGIGRKNKTILPAWLVSLIIAIISYLILTYIIVIPKIKNY